MKKILIIFTDLHLPYSPTMINLYDCLSQDFDVTIVAPEPDSLFGKQDLQSRKINYVKISENLSSIRDNLIYFFLRIAIKLGYFKEIKQFYPEQKLKLFLLWKEVKKREADEIIGVDFTGLWIAQSLFNKGHLLSLEISEAERLSKYINTEKIESVIIQTEERYKYLFPDLNLKRFLVQNAPIYKPLRSISTVRQGLIFCGTACGEFGIYYCLNFIAEYPEFTLTIRGSIAKNVRNKIENKYQDLIDNNRLIIDEIYIKQEDLFEYLSQFSIGFCFYDLEKLSKIKNIDIFDYLTCPSGKLFSYYAAGLPVIGSNIPGLSSVENFNTGVLINNYSPLSIKKAIDNINEDFIEKSNNCLKAAEYFSFDRAVQPFKDYLKNKKP